MKAQRENLSNVQIGLFGPSGSCRVTYISGDDILGYFGFGFGFGFGLSWAVRNMPVSCVSRRSSDEVTSANQSSS
jgi:hypothetical protein